jgi:hypothetical protein
MDYVYLTEITRLEDLTKYPVLFYPHAAILTEDRVKLLTEYVQAGGVHSPKRREYCHGRLRQNRDDKPSHESGPGQGIDF